MSKRALAEIEKEIAFYESAVKVGDDLHETYSQTFRSLLADLYTERSAAGEEFDMLIDGFDFPVGTESERASDALPPGAWWLAMNYAEGYPAWMKRNDWHTGIDCNLPGQADSGKTVYSAANGIVVAAGAFPAWLELIVVRHTLIDGARIFTRYAHVARIEVKPGDVVKRGQPIAVIGDYGKVGKAEDHLHYDIANGDEIDLGHLPTHWPGTDLALLKRCYYPPIDFTRSHRPVRA